MYYKEENMTFAKNLKYLREKYGLNKKELAQRLDIKNFSSIGYWEDGKYLPNSKSMNKIATYFGCTVKMLKEKDLEKTDMSDESAISIYERIGSLREELKSDGIKIEYDPVSERIYVTGGNELFSDPSHTYLDMDFKSNISYIKSKIRPQKDINLVPLVGTISAGYGLLADENISDYFEIDKSIKADFCLRVSGDSMVDVGIYDGDVAFLKQQNNVENGEIAAVLIQKEDEYEAKATLKRFYKNGNSIILYPENRDYEPIFVNKDDRVLVIGKLVSTLHNNFN